MLFFSSGLTNSYHNTNLLSDNLNAANEPSQEKRKSELFFLDTLGDSTYGLKEMILEDKNRTFVQIGSVIKTVLKKYRHESDEDLTRIWSFWEKVVGPVIAENAQPAAFKGNILILHVSSSTWIQQLRFLKKDMIAKINDAIGKEMVLEIKFKIGSLY